MGSFAPVFVHKLFDFRQEQITQLTHGGKSAKINNWMLTPALPKSGAAGKSMRIDIRLQPHHPSDSVSAYSITIHAKSRSFRKLGRATC
jgi:hypothetical protein